MPLYITTQNKKYLTPKRATKLIGSYSAFKVTESDGLRAHHCRAMVTPGISSPLLSTILEETTVKSLKV